ncbi:hypothetical protein A5774_09050 [Corynebacterium sp. EPI-003-04-2554_SCH2473622]|nr:hypothetical protein A5774_09050 [Corynebacterium sp. EPI-003-04-2554_SCH2473622]
MWFLFIERLKLPNRSLKANHTVFGDAEPVPLVTNDASGHILFGWDRRPLKPLDASNLDVKRVGTKLEIVPAIYGVPKKMGRRYFRRRGFNKMLLTQSMLRLNSLNCTASRMLIIPEIYKNAQCERKSMVFSFKSHG